MLMIGLGQDGKGIVFFPIFIYGARLPLAFQLCVWVWVPLSFFNIFCLCFFEGVIQVERGRPTGADQAAFWGCVSGWVCCDCSCVCSLKNQLIHEKFRFRMRKSEDWGKFSLNSNCQTKGLHKKKWWGYNHCGINDRVMKHFDIETCHAGKSELKNSADRIILSILSCL